MDAPWVPPYFGSYEQLVQELLGNPSSEAAAPTGRRGSKRYRPAQRVIRGRAHGGSPQQSTLGRTHGGRARPAT
jgi:hypothetical protein